MLRDCNPRTEYPKSLAALLLAAVSLGIGPLPAASQALSNRSGHIWVGAWGNAPANALPAAIGSEQSFRFLILPTLGGDTERIRLSNYWGTQPVTVGAAHLAVSAKDAAIDPGTDRTVRFNGSEKVTIPPGGVVLSDPVKLPFSFGQKLAVSIYLPSTFGPLSHHNSLVTTSYSTAPKAGDHTASLDGKPFQQTTTEWLLLSGLDLYGDYQGTLAQIGGSTTDGTASNTGDTVSYPTRNQPIPGQDDQRETDWLARILNQAGYRIGILNEGIGGNTAGPAPSNATTHQEPGILRFQRDVLSQPSLKAVILYLGANDLRSSTCATAETLETYTRQMAAAASAVKVRVILATIAPSTFCTNAASPNFGLTPSPAQPYNGATNPEEAQRFAYNVWVKSVGLTLPGVVAIADFDHALADPAHPSFMIPNLNSGDNIHPNGSGYHAQAGAVPIQSILP
jgi:lysophospholipase L1-like esterase